MGLYQKPPVAFTASGMLRFWLFFLSGEPFAKVPEWFDSQLSMEAVNLFPLLRLKPSDASSPSAFPLAWECRGMG
jgi:hypothetical protein